MVCRKGAGAYAEPLIGSAVPAERWLAPQSTNVCSPGVSSAFFYCSGAINPISSFLSRL